MARLPRRPRSSAARAAGALLIALLAALAGAALVAAPARAASVSLLPGSVVAAFTESGSDSLLPPAPAVGTAAYSFPGAASATRTSYDVADLDTAVAIDFAHAHDPAGAYGPIVVSCDPFCAGSTATIRFAVADPVAYTLTGAYQAMDGHGRDVAFRLALVEIGTGAALFTFDETRSGVPDVSLQAGPARGVLLAGREYELSLEAALASDLAAAGLASASGFAQLAFAPIPEPGTGVLVGAGLAAASAGRRRRP